MASIPLPALDLKQAAPPPDPLASFQRLMALRSLSQQQQNEQGQQALQQQEIQKNQVALNDQQATSSAMRAWDGKDMNDLPSLVLKNGGSSNAVFGMKNQILSYQKNLQEMTKDQLANEDKKNDAIAGHLDYVQKLPPEQQAQGFENAKTDLVKRGYMTPQEAQGLQYQGSDQLAQMEKLYQSHSQQVDQALKTAQTTKAVADTAQANATTDEKRQTSQFYANSGVGAPGVPAETVSMLDWLRQNPGKTPSDYPAAKAASVAQAEAPTKIAAAAAEGAARANTEINTKRQETSDTQFQTAIGSDERLNRMEKSYTEAVTNHNQQAMLALLTDHIGMTLGLQKGARITKDIINEAAKSQPWLAGLGAKFDSDGYLSGVNLSNGQMKQMLDLGYTARENSWDAASKTAQMYGVKPPQNAQQIYNSRDPNSRVYDKTQGAGKTLSMAQIQKAAQDHGVSVDEATRQAKAQGYNVQ